ncbi:AraC family transcriptional regulator [Caballeronia choica]|jgi:AraC-like DNA-binding protein|uniref:AraC family transcriptional regulator n=1 Tax=Caballeronia choica TaxID=326476 RepID=A0A158K3C8_9BURK|nr:AraC family transcriptional regulator [Caballeronia choica]SAL74981.1 AraC family transcriptional regulator [Caballeronia choica]
MPAASSQRPARVARAATPVAFVNAVLLGYKKYGADPSDALREAQIAPALLKEPGARVTASQFEALCRVAMQQLDDEALGWFSRRLPWGTYGLLCRASFSSPNLGVALKRWCRHQRLLTDDIALELVIEDDIATLQIEERRRFGALREFCLVTTLRCVHGFACWLIDSRIPLIETRFPFQRPPHGAVHSLLFPGPVHFAQDRACMRFAAEYLTLAPRRDERALSTMLQHALPLTVLQYRRDRLLASRARSLMTARPSEPHTAPALASALNVSVRTLHRQLEEEGTSLQALKDAVRREQAIEQLCRTTQPIKQIALSLGFASEKTFARAFRHWTGESPTEYRHKSSASTR